MKKIFFTASLTATLIFLGISCSKLMDESSSAGSSDSPFTAQDRTDNDFALTTSDVSYTNGLLAFKDGATLNAVTTSLDDLDASTTFKTSFLATKTSAALDPESADYVVNPGMQAFEERFSGFTSLRRRIQDAERSFLAAGGNPGDFDEGDIKSPTIQTILNNQGEIKIGDIIIRRVTEHISLLVLDGNFTTLNTIRSWSNPYEPNLPPNVIRLDDRLEEDQATERDLLGGTCTPTFTYYTAGTNQYNLHPLLISGYNAWIPNSVNWEIKNSNGVVIFTSTQIYPNTGTLPNATYPLTVKATMTTPACDGPFVCTKTINGSQDCNFTPTFGEDDDDLGNLHFKIGSQPGAGNTFIWTLKPEYEPAQTFTGETFDYNAGSGEYKLLVTVTMTTTSGCNVTKSFIINIKCGDTYDVSKVTQYTSNRLAKAETWIDNPTFLHHSFGARLKNYKKSGNNYVLDNADNLKFTPAVNSKFIKECDNSVFLNANGYTVSNQNLLQCKYEYGTTTKITVRQGEMTLRYSVTENGVSYPDIITISY